MENILSWKLHGKWKKVMEIKNILGKVMEFLYCLSRITHKKFWWFQIYRPAAVIWLWEVFGLCSKLKIVMLGRRQTIFLTPYFKFEKRLHLLFVYIYAMNMCDDLLCLPSWYHGKHCKLSWKSHVILLSDFGGNPAYNIDHNSWYRTAHDQPTWRAMASGHGNVIIESTNS